MGSQNTSDVRKPLEPIKADYSLAWSLGLSCVVAISLEF